MISTIYYAKVLNKWITIKLYILLLLKYANNYNNNPSKGISVEYNVTC